MDNEKNIVEVENDDLINNKPVLHMNDKNNSQEQDTLINGTLKSQWQIISPENGGSHKESQCSNGHKNGADNQSL